MKFTSAVSDQCVTVNTTDRRSFRVWKSLMIEEWNERNLVWKYAYDLPQEDRVELIAYSRKYFFETLHSGSGQYSDVISTGGMDPRNRAKITCTCHHEVVDFNDTVNSVIADYDRMGQPAVSVVTYCKPCYEKALKAGYVLEEDEDVYRWLNS